MKEKTADSSDTKVIILSVLGAVAVLGFIAYAVLNLGEEVTGIGKKGEVIDKVFKPQPERQISIGEKGLAARDVKGEFILKVYVEKEDKLYNVWVAERVYREHEIGDPYFIVPPPRREVPVEEAVQ